MIESPFATLPFCQYHVCILSTSDKKSFQRTHCKINHIKPQLEIKNTFYHKVKHFREENREIEK
jgi:hypothetical protein